MYRLRNYRNLPDRGNLHHHCIASGQRQLCRGSSGLAKLQRDVNSAAPDHHLHQPGLTTRRHPADTLRNLQFRSRYQLCFVHTDRLHGFRQHSDFPGLRNLHHHGITNRQQHLRGRASRFPKLQCAPITKHRLSESRHTNRRHAADSCRTPHFRPDTQLHLVHLVGLHRLRHHSNVPGPRNLHHHCLTGWQQHVRRCAFGLSELQCAGRADHYVSEPWFTNRRNTTDINRDRKFRSSGQLYQFHTRCLHCLRQHRNLPDCGNLHHQRIAGGQL